MTTKIGVLIYTYNRIDDARINMEIIRNVWAKNEILKNITIVHTYNGDEEWYKEKYLEDDLIRLKNQGHFKGAENLIDEGMRVFKEKHPDIDYIITLASDTWLVKPDYVASLIRDMQTEKKYLATCSWGTKKETNMFKIGMSLDFFILDAKWSNSISLFPLGYSQFREQYGDIFDYQDITIYPERVLAFRFKRAIQKSIEIPSENLIKKVTYSYIRHIKEREPVHIFTGGFFTSKKQERQMYWSELGLFTHHNSVDKQKLLKAWNLSLGEYGKNFIESHDLSYFNKGHTKTVFEKDGKKINYND